MYICVGEEVYHELLLVLNVACLSEKQQMPICFSFPIALRVPDEGYSIKRDT
jgi:hypothetical protein